MNRVWILLFAVLMAIVIAMNALQSRDSTRRESARVDSTRIETKALLSTDQTRSLTAVEFTPAEPTYVGREVCRECHAENYHLHGNHGHKSTFATTDNPEIIKMFAGKSYDAGEPYGTYTYHADEDGLFARIPEKFGERAFRLNYALGSTDGAVTLLSLMPDPERGTVAIEHRASWFSDTGELRPTPLENTGPPKTPADFFGLRHEGEVMHKCVYCHTTRGRIVDQEIVDLVPNVNCEKCHGPASEHVRQARAMREPPKFSVGRDDWDTESEIQLCGDCHRLPVTVSRTKLREYPDELTRFQPVGLLRSKCFVESEGKLKCSTCHNPHETVAAVPKEKHQQNCIACHLEDSPQHVACPVSPREGCIECHMPAIELAGLSVSFHDHWIRVHQEE